ncbi:sensor histidine kinase [Dactylosporangium sp. NPDC048998]|uniref:sensor histidine kinase n=1 Tax=Dactylosporangium sp. NPDC048998 TaxID=3363976 RepID=UPI00371DE603
MQRVSRVDAVVAAGFVLAGVAEAALVGHTGPGHLLLNVVGALLLAVLAVRRRRPVLAIAGVAVAGVLVAVVPHLVWPPAGAELTVPMLAFMVASYSLGAHALSRVVLWLGVLLPLGVVLAVDLTAMMRGWQLLNGVLFVTLFLGLVPMLVGRAVRARQQRLSMLREQRERIECQQRANAESAVLAERLYTLERLRPTLLEGMRALSGDAESGTDPGAVEEAARELLTRTREEVVALTAPADEAISVVPPAAEHLPAFRVTAQPWVALTAGAIAAGLATESAGVLAVPAAGWVAVLASVAVGLPLVAVWRLPVTSVALAWLAAATYSHLGAPLGGTLSEAGLAVATSFAVGALSRRRMAVVGLVVCWAGHAATAANPEILSDEAAILAFWLGGLAVNEVTRLVEQTRANNELLAGQEESAARRAVVSERVRMARELHDVIGHSLTVVALQAGAARRLSTTDPARVPDVMRTIVAAARDGVAVLEPADAEPNLAAIIDRTRATGLPVDADVMEVAALGSQQRAVVLRVIQEALTNVLRHGPGSPVTVVVRRDEEQVQVQVRNSAPTRPGSGPVMGRGLAGIRERVAAADGQVTWGPCDDGGFEVRAVLPLPAPADVEVQA